MKQFGKTGLDEKYIIYVNPENYLPYGTEHHDFMNNQVTETEYLTIEIGTVDRLPVNYDIEKLKENATPQVVGESGV